jgi:hypothetical protein
VRAVAATLALLAVAGCRVPVATLRFAAATPLAADPGTLRPQGPGEGRSCRWWLAGVPFGLPQIDEAVRDALGTRGRALQDVTVSSDHPFYVVFGRHCYTVKGEILG